MRVIRGRMSGVSMTLYRLIAWITGKSGSIRGGIAGGLRCVCFRMAHIGKGAFKEVKNGKFTAVRQVVSIFECH